MTSPSRSFCRLLLLGAAGVVSVLGADTFPQPRPWEPDAFLPVTEARVATLPAPEQAAWRAYLAASAEILRQLPPRDLVDHSSSNPIPVGSAGASYSKGLRLKAQPAWYATEEARTVADRVIRWQTPAGGWTKSGDYTRDPVPADNHHDSWSAGTFDNDATIHELRYLALVAQAASEDPRAGAWRDGFLRGLNYALAAQYPNGGFPQVFPLVGWYHDAITYNDDAMVHILELLRDVAARHAEFAFVPASLGTRAGHACERGIACILASQLRDATGRRTIWAQQCDPLTLQACAARNFEPISACSNESTGLVHFLMSIPAPSPEIIAAVEGAIAWFPIHALHGVTWDRRSTAGTGLVPRAGAPDLWARFYELGTDRPVFGDRDRTIHYNVNEISPERRQGYGWYNSRAAELPPAYASWKEKIATH